MFLVMRIKLHTVFILQNKLLKNMMIYYYYRILKILIMSYFSGSKVSECHVKTFLAINPKKSVLFPEENEYVNFRHFKRLIKAPIILYDDF